MKPCTTKLIGFIGGSLLTAITCVAQQSANPTTPSVPTTLVSTGVNIGLGLSDTQKVGIVVPIPNSTGSAVDVLGVQTTGDLFVEAVPPTIPANGSVNLTVIYYGTGGTSGGMDTVRILTSAGLIVVPVTHGRPQAVTLSTTSLSWAVGETDAKSVTINVAGGATMPKAAHAYGVGNTASITFQSAGAYVLTVQPGSTAQASRFPVIVDLDPALPDVFIAINCTVGLPQGS